MSASNSYIEGMFHVSLTLNFIVHCYFVSFATATSTTGRLQQILLHNNGNNRRRWSHNREFNERNSDGISTVGRRLRSGRVISQTREWNSGGFRDLQLINFPDFYHPIVFRCTKNALDNNFHVPPCPEAKKVHIFSPENDKTSSQSVQSRTMGRETKGDIRKMAAIVESSPKCA